MMQSMLKQDPYLSTTVESAEIEEDFHPSMIVDSLKRSSSFDITPEDQIKKYKQVSVKARFGYMFYLSKREISIKWVFTNVSLTP